VVAKFGHPAESSALSRTEFHAFAKSANARNAVTLAYRVDKKGSCRRNLHVRKDSCEFDSNRACDQYKNRREYCRKKKERNAAVKAENTEFSRKRRENG